MTRTDFGGAPAGLLLRGATAGPGITTSQLVVGTVSRVIRGDGDKRPRQVPRVYRQLTYYREGMFGQRFPAITDKTPLTG
ncbi:hypothetical protein GCM10009663_28480 [Kitasatospora arboriphila]|uniref:Uncharacterized protein n=1 Tax=Kitasatospora arboriphila TaxID=258052 RepID=A0ABP4E149_9ACTN